MDCYMNRRRIRDIVSDTFNRSNGYLGNAETGQTWLSGAVATTKWVVYSNRAHRASATRDVADVAAISCGTPNVVVSADITFGGLADQMSLFARMSGGTHDNCMSVYFRHGTIANVIIQRIISGTIVDLATANYTINAGSTYACSFACIGNRFSVSINGAVVVTATDDNALESNVQVGMFIPLYSTFTTASDYMDNFTARG